MSSRSITDSLDALSLWRRALDEQVAGLGAEGMAHDLLQDDDQNLLRTLRERLATEKLVVAFVAEFSRGKSELINAIFFADTGRRVLPATPGRTTMCPVELRYESAGAASLSLLPIETRLQNVSLSELRAHREHWTRRPLDADNPEALARALAAVTETRPVSVEEATAYGFWHESQPDDNPPRLPDGRVEVPAWRHAVVNYPHPLLQKGLVIIDTPGLNAVGAEPELTLGLLPSAHAVVFVLGADTGVTRSDRAMWRDHLAHRGLESFVVLNKIDSLDDPLLASQAIEEQISNQVRTAAKTLEVPEGRVYPLSARLALAARVEGNDTKLQSSGLLPLEAALGAQLLPRRQTLLLHATESAFERMHQAVQRRLADRRRLLSEQLMELRGLRGKSSMKTRMLLARADGEVEEFERCVTRLSALRAVHERMHMQMLSGLAPEHLHQEVTAMQAAMSARLFNLGARSAFDELLRHLCTMLIKALAQAVEMRRMLDASYAQLNAEYGFTFVVGPPPRLESFTAELDLIATGYGKYLGLTQAWRKAAPGFADQFRRMLLSKLRVIFENASAELDLWSKGALAQVSVQLHERRRSYARRSEALRRVEAASGDLEQRIAEVEAQEVELEELRQRLSARVAAAIELARRGPSGMDLEKGAAELPASDPLTQRQPVAA